MLGGGGAGVRKDDIYNAGYVPCISWGVYAGFEKAVQGL